MRRAARDDRAQALVEFALVLPLVLLLMVGLFDAARAVFVSNTLTFAAREGVRYAVVHGQQSGEPSGPGGATYTAPDTDTAVADAVRRNAIGVAGLTVSATWTDGTSARGAEVVVSASAPYTPVLSEAIFGGGLRLTLSGSSTGVIHR